MTRHDVSHRTHKNFKPGHRSFLGPEDENLINKPNVEWNSSANKMMQEFVESGHSVFKCSFPLSRGVRKREKGKDSTPSAQHLQSSPDMILKVEVGRDRQCFSKHRSQGQVSHEAGFSKVVEVRHFFVTGPAIVPEENGITTTCRQYSAMRDDPTAKGVLGEIQSSGPSTMQRFHCSMDDRALRCRSIP